MIRTFVSPQDVTEVYEFYNRNVTEIGYARYETKEAFTKHILEDENFNSDGFFVAIEDNRICGICLTIIQKQLLQNETYEEAPGYICLLIVDTDKRRRGIGTSLLNQGVNYLRTKGKKNIQITHKCPIKFTWDIHDSGAQHNKAPGVKTDSYGYDYLIKQGFTVKSYELAYYRNLKGFTFPEDIKETQTKLLTEGYTVDYFDVTKHQGYEEMFTRLHDESYRKKFREGIKRDAQMLVVLKDDQEVCGCVGEIYAEANGRGFFQGVAVDPKHSGKKLGNLLFFRLCEELQRKHAKYMTLFVSEDNFAKKIYEKAGFEVVQRWAILNLEESYHE